MTLNKTKHYKCEYCKMAFNKYGNLLNHIKKRHNDVWIKDLWYQKEDFHRR